MSILMKFLFFIFSAVIIFSCSQSQDRVTESGLKYRLIVDGGQGVAADSMVMDLDIKFWYNGDSLLGENKSPFQKIPGAESQGPLLELFFELGKGDSAVFSMQVKEYFEKSNLGALPPNMDENGEIRIDIAVRDVLPMDEYNVMAEKKRETERLLLKEKEEVALKDYFEQNQINPEKTESGLFISIHEEGTGEVPESGDKIAVNYKGMLLNGNVFDTSIEAVAKENNLYNEKRTYAPFEFIVGRGQVIRGWDEAFTQVKVGTKATIFIPSPLAYGTRSPSPAIPANSTLIFEVELIDILK